MGGHIPPKPLGIIPVGTRRVTCPPLAAAGVGGRHIHNLIAIPMTAKRQVRVEGREVPGELYKLVFRAAEQKATGQCTVIRVPFCISDEEISRRTFGSRRTGSISKMI